MNERDKHYLTPIPEYRRMGLHNPGELDFLRWLDIQLENETKLQETTMLELEVTGRFPLAVLKTAVQYHDNHTVLIGSKESYDLSLRYDDIPDTVHADSTFQVCISINTTYEDCRKENPHEDPSYWEWNGGMSGFLFTCREQYSRYR